jgi:hypothetical protein
VVYYQTVWETLFIAFLSYFLHCVVSSIELDYFIYRKYWEHISTFHSSHEIHMICCFVCSWLFIFGGLFINKLHCHWFGVVGKFTATFKVMIELVPLCWLVAEYVNCYIFTGAERLLLNQQRNTVWHIVQLVLDQLFPDFLIHYPCFGFHKIFRSPSPIIGIQINVTLCTQFIAHDDVTHNYFTDISGVRRLFRI